MNKSILWCTARKTSNSGRFLAFSTITFHLRRSCTYSVHFMSFNFFRSFLTSSSLRNLSLPTGLPVNGFQLCIFFTIIVSGILFVSRPTQSLDINIIYYVPVFINSFNSMFVLILQLPLSSLVGPAFLHVSILFRSSVGI